MRFSFFITTFLLLISGSLAVRQRDGRHSNTPSRKFHAGPGRASRAPFRAHLEKTSNRADRFSKRGGPVKKAGPAKKETGRISGNGGISKPGKEKKQPTCSAGMMGNGKCKELKDPKGTRRSAKDRPCHKEYPPPWDSMRVDDQCGWKGYSPVRPQSPDKANPMSCTMLPREQIDCWPLEGAFGDLSRVCWLLVYHAFAIGIYAPSERKVKLDIVTAATELLRDFGSSN